MILFKLYKVHKNHVEFSSSITREEEFNDYVELLKLFELNIGSLTCSCSYDKARINLVFIDGEVNLELVETEKKFLRTIRFKETEVSIDSVETLKKLLKISDTHDALLVFKSKNESDAENVFVINDNGHDYVNFDKSKYNVKELKTKISRILNG